MLPWLWVQMRLCDVVHGIYGGNSPPNTDARLLFAWYACVYPDEYTRRKKRMRSQEGERCKSALKHRRKSSYRLLCSRPDTVICFILVDKKPNKDEAAPRCFQPSFGGKKCQAASGRGVKNKELSLKTTSESRWPQQTTVFTLNSGWWSI